MYTILNENKGCIDDMSVEIEESNVEMEIEITIDRLARKRQLNDVSGDPRRDVKKSPNSSPIKSPIENSSKITESNLSISTEPPTKNKKHPVEVKSDNASMVLKYIKSNIGPFKVI